ncbi:uncharacterized protein PHALS_05110 [Plasmopara halstedii]|uniref:RxLR-like protein n=1 Tax=Plasmopara halstedii TaxID=4781 RepID=A0A0P1B087_PLAHL|nr:uncharacterized protein PHALS_05110 [Plasmopara halstedii]CEG47774.1 hypothetical protein PHALS_05110 [Plasmopara halstedii]|eukprot:XP_024584143.1 hypothetical protein PHALS_05110 [Plasmopara halstedii]
MNFLAAMILCIAEVKSHGYLSFPAAVYRDPYTATSFVTTITESINIRSFGNRKWNDTPERNAAMFATAFHNSSYSSLREMLDPVVSDCGNTREDVAPVNVTNAKELLWQNDEEHRGFVDSHHGPCEVWIDNHRALFNDDCRATFTSYPAHLPIDFNALCDGQCHLKFYWLALHEAAWQVYKACAPIVNSNHVGFV